MDTKSAESKSTMCLDAVRLAEHLAIKLSTLAAWRVRGGGPKFTKVGRCVRYRISDVESWLASRGRENTGQK
jgi:predicted DNA-binding transcriptional regulator AlpA